MGYYDPPGYHDWEAEAWCDQCEKDTDHYFARPYGRRTIAYATCEVCERETEYDPDDFEE